MKKKPEVIDIIAMIACVLIAVICILDAIFFNGGHVCKYCHKKIFGDTYVVCDGINYYHTECYKEELQDETD